MSVRLFRCRWYFYVLPRFYREWVEWDLGACRGLCVDWLGFTFQWKRPV